MSELGQTEKSGRSTGRSALPPTPDMSLHRANSRFVPRAVIVRWLIFTMTSDREVVNQCQSRLWSPDSMTGSELPPQDLPNSLTGDAAATAPRIVNGLTVRPRRQINPCRTSLRSPWADTVMSVWLTRLDSNGYCACPDQAAEAVAGFEFDLDVLRTRIK